MSAVIRHGVMNICFGVDERWLKLPISNLPPDTIRVRRRLRCNSVAIAFVATADKVEEWCLRDDGDSLSLWGKRGANVRSKSKPNFVIQNP